MSEERLTTWQVEAVLCAIARKTCKDEGVPWLHAGDWSYETKADYGDKLRLQWDHERASACLSCGCRMTLHIAIPTVQSHVFCPSCTYACQNVPYKGPARFVK